MTSVGTWIDSRSRRSLLGRAQRELSSVTNGVLKITPLDNQESEEAELLTRQAYGLMPRIKITDLLLDAHQRAPSEGGDD